MVDSRQLECFVAVAEEAHFGRAAVRLNMTQPPLTRRIHRLELEVGAPLLVRGARGVELTAPGEVLLVEARRVLDDATRALEKARAAEAGRTGRLLVGYTGSAVLDLMPQVLASFTAAFPETTLRLSRMGKARLREAIDEGSLHVGFARVQGEWPGATVRSVGDSKLAVALPTRMKVRDRPALTDLARMPLVVFPRARPSFADEVQVMCERAGFIPNVVAEADDALDAVAVVSTGVAVALVPRPVAGIRLPGVRYEPLRDSPSLELSCVVRDDNASPVVRAFLVHLDGERMSGAR